jgi:hypothetical protein
MLINGCAFQAYIRISDGILSRQQFYLGIDYLQEKIDITHMV